MIKLFCENFWLRFTEWLDKPKYDFVDEVINRIEDLK